MASNKNDAYEHRHYAFMKMCTCIKLEYNIASIENTINITLHRVKKEHTSTNRFIKNKERYHNILRSHNAQTASLAISVYL